MELKENLIKINDINLKLYDLSTSKTLYHINEDVFENDEYKILKMQFNDDDVILDIGANVGSVSIYIAKKNPNTKIYSFEALDVNYNNLIKNIEVNNVKNITPYNLAVSSSDGDEFKISLCQHNTGSSSGFKVDTRENMYYSVPTISLDSIIRNNNIKKIKFLKMDCEGSEFDILLNSKLIHEIEIENISVEVHTFVKNQSVEDLVNLINKVSINPPNIKIYTLG